MSEEIVLSDYLEELRREIQSLREQLSVLLQEKEDLIYHVCPKLESRYASVIGVYENRAHYLELQILELKRRIEMMQAAINRAKTISMEQMEDQIRKEYQAFHDKVEEERKKRSRIRSLRERRKRRSRNSGRHGKRSTERTSPELLLEMQTREDRKRRMLRTKVVILSETKPMGRSQEITGNRGRIRLQILRICTGRL